MEVCPNCFSDRELRGFLRTASNRGNCTVCGSKNTELMDVAELLDFFQQLIDNFEIREAGTSLRSKLQDWNFFSNDKVALTILNEVLPRISTRILSPNDQVVYTADIRENYLHWEQLKKSLKTERRYLINIRYLEEELGWGEFFSTGGELNPNANLYRARIHHQRVGQPYSKADMFSPPPLIVKGGRANPLGIPYLYLSDTKETVLYEVRASYLDELSIARFRVKDQNRVLKIADFTEELPLFTENVKETIKAKLLREKISEDLSKPMRRYDSELEYIPTQFICEFIKVHAGVSGIKFRSSLHPKGNNVVIFDQNLMECVGVDLESITSLKMESKLKIKSSIL